MSEMPNSAPNDAMPSVMTVVTDLIEGQRETHLLVTQANVSTQYRITKLARIIEKQVVARISIPRAVIPSAEHRSAISLAARSATARSWTKRHICPIRAGQ